MTSPTLRLVVGDTTEPGPQTIEVPTLGASALHIHLHIGAAPGLTPSIPSSAETEVTGGQTERKPRRKILLALSACVLALVSYEYGAHSDSVRAPAATRPAPPPQAALVLPNPNEMPPAMRQQLASPPILTPPPGVQTPSGAPNPFGLHP